MIHCLVDKMDNYNFPESEVTSLDVLFCQTNSPNPKDIQFNIIYDKEKHQIITSEKLKTANFVHFCLKKR